MAVASIMFCGDFAPIGGMETCLLKHGTSIFGFANPSAQKADIGFVNLEAPFVLRGKPIRKDGPHLKALRECGEVLVGAGFSVWGGANNHINDFGHLGIEYTLETAEDYGATVVGAGSNIADASKVQVIVVNDVRVAIVAAAEHEFCIAGIGRAGAASADPISLYARILEAKKCAERVIVTLHGGVENCKLPRPQMRKLCRFLVDAGSDAVVCHHPHVAGPYEVYKGKPIFYSIGNFLFDDGSDKFADWYIGYSVKLSFPSDCDQVIFEVIPFRQSIETCGVTSLNSKDEREFQISMEHFNLAMIDDVLYNKEWNRILEDLGRRLAVRAFLPFSFGRIEANPILVPLGAMFSFGAKSIAMKSNVIRCESHREVLLGYLEEKLGGVDKMDSQVS